MSADDLVRQANTLAEKLRRARDTSRSGQAPDAHELATMETRLAGLWAAIRQARAAPPERNPERRVRTTRDPSSFDQKRR
jgi:hypothetical protein